MSQDHTTVFAWGFSHTGNFSVAVAEIHLYVDWHCLRSDCIHVECIPNIHDQEMMWFVKISKFHQFLRQWSHVLLSSSHFKITYEHRQEQTFVFVDQKVISSSELCPIQVPTELPRTVLPTRDQQMGVRTKFRSRGTTGSSTCDHDLGHLGRGRRIHIFGHILTLKFSATVERPPFLPGCELILRQRLVQHILVISQ